MREAAELEESTPKHAVTPGPTIPARELLGDLLMEQKKYSDALAAYKRSLELYPKRLNSLRGATRAAKAMGENRDPQRLSTPSACEGLVLAPLRLSVRAPRWRLGY